MELGFSHGLQIRLVSVDDGEVPWLDGGFRRARFFSMSSRSNEIGMGHLPRYGGSCSCTPDGERLAGTIGIPLPYDFWRGAHTQILSTLLDGGHSSLSSTRVEIS